MYTINHQIIEQKPKGLQVTALVKTNALEILTISMEKDTTFPVHTSPKDAQLIVLEGDIDFHINQTKYNLKTYENFNFPAEEEHWVLANKNSKFLIVR
ncbi:cupin domain-containing protein [Flagellimonas sp. 2504JD4-2]